MQAVGGQTVNGGLIKHAFCAVLPFPDKMKTSNTAASLNEIAALHDFGGIVWKWLMSSDFLNTSFYDDLKEKSDTEQKLIRAFGDVFEPIRNTRHPEEHEMVLLYYSGSGSEALTDKCSSPFIPEDQFSKDRIREYSNVEEKYFPSQQRIKDGKLSLNAAGYSDLQGLLVPWIAALAAKSKNAPDVTKRNKHLVVIADSCYSGMLVEDLMKLALKDGPWNQNGCTVTVQSATNSQENILDGHFTPCFVHFNQRENRTFANLLINEWNVKSETEKDSYIYEELPSPQLASTMLFSKDEASFELNIQGSKLRLFHDARFFKFYSLSFSGILGNKGHPLTTDEATIFLSQQNFKILDYKLKTMPSRTTPIALALVDDPKDTDHVVCVRIHFRSSDANIENLNGVSFIHYKRPKQEHYLALLFLQDKLDTKSMFSPHACQIQALIKQCRAFVENKNPEEVRFCSSLRSADSSAQSSCVIL